jgi:electron transport complex protein RnfC
MMGNSIHSIDEPITKTTGSIVALNTKDATLDEPTNCIHCGRCVSSCPMFLNPTEFSKALNIEILEERIARLEEYHINLCMECGCCSYVCPASRPLVQNNRLGKIAVKSYHDHQSNLK